MLLTITTTITTTILTLIASVSAAAVCPPGPTRFRIHPQGHPDRCVAASPDSYNDVSTGWAWHYAKSQISWPNVVLSKNHIWEWFVLDGETMLRNPDQNWPETIPYLDDPNVSPASPRSPHGMILCIYQYEFPIHVGSGFILVWYYPNKSPACQWKYTTDLQLISGYLLNGKEACMDVKNGDVDFGGGGLALQLVPCEANNPNQQWVFEYI